MVPDNETDHDTEIDIDEVVLDRLANLTTAPPPDWTQDILNQSLPEYIKHELIGFFTKDYPNLVPRDEFDPGCLNPNIYMIEDFGATGPPVRSKVIPLHGEMRDRLKRIIDIYVERGLMTRGISPYASPLFLVKKNPLPGQPVRDRMVANYKALNKTLNPLAYPNQDIQSIFTKIGNAKPVLFSSLDLTSAFTSVQIKPGSKAMYQSSVITDFGQFHMTRLGMGISSSPAIFSIVMDKIMTNLQAPKLKNYPIQHSFVVGYQDDVCTFTTQAENMSEEDLHQLHLLQICVILAKISAAGLKINPAKCKFFQKEIPLLGRLVTRQGFTPLDKHIQQLKDFPRPFTVKGIQQFMGTCNYLRQHIPNFSQKITPLTELLKKNTPFIWSDSQEKAFRTLKESICKTSQITYPDFNDNLYLYVDGSNVAVGNVLLQIKTIPDVEFEKAKRFDEHELDQPILLQQGKNVPQVTDVQGNKIDSIKFDPKKHLIMPIAFGSKALTPSQKQYSTIKLEALAIVTAFHQHQDILKGARRIVLVSDSAPLLYILKGSTKISLLERWSLYLQSFNYSICISHVSGTHNTIADMLSRRSAYIVTDKTTDTFNSKTAFVVKTPYPIGSVITYRHLQQALEKDPSLVTPINPSNSSTTVTDTSNQRPSRSEIER